MSDDYTQVIILCEDKQQEVFLRRFLVKCGVNARRIRVRPVPGGKGSGEQWVREQFAKEVKEHRSRAARLNIALLVMQDADVASLEDRRQALEHRLKAAGEGPRASEERIAMFFPRRNIESWIDFLNNGTQIEETKLYANLAEQSDCYPGVDSIAIKNDYHLSANVPPSLRAACAEIRRIFPQKRCIDQ